MRVWPGHPSPLGATWDGKGVNFALFSEHATQVDLCLFEAVDAPTETHRIPLPEQTDQVWHAYLPEVSPGQLYAIACTAPMRRRRATASTRTRWCSTPMPKRSAAISDGPTNFSAIAWATRRRTSPMMTAIARRMPPWRWLLILLYLGG